MPRMWAIGRTASAGGCRVIEASCHCGDVRLRIETAPTVLNNCQCPICRRYGALWAYYHPSQVQIIVSGAQTDTYTCGDPARAYHRCGRCGCVTHWTGARLQSGQERMGVNAHLMARDAIRHSDVLRIGRPCLDH